MECLACLGEGEIVLSDLAAVLEEHLPDEQLAAAKRLAGDSWGGTFRCPECEGTGVISAERHAEMWAAATAQVDQVLAMFREEVFES